MQNNPPSSAGSHSTELSCPHCGLINPAHALCCNCGYQFQTGSTMSGQSWSQTAEANLGHWVECLQHIVNQSGIYWQDKPLKLYDVE